MGGAEEAGGTGPRGSELVRQAREPDTRGCRQKQAFKIQSGLPPIAQCLLCRRCGFDP